MTTNKVQILNPQIVLEIFAHCLFRKGDYNKLKTTIEGIRGDVYFETTRLREKDNDVWELLNELSDDFKASGGGGTSLISGCADRHGHLWSGEQVVVEKLFLLGMGIKKVKYFLPSKFWPTLAGGVPYYIILDK